MFRKLINLFFLFLFSLLFVMIVAIGQPPAEKVIDLDKGEESIRILGDDEGDQSGYSVSSGDINGDGYDDVIIGAPYADPPGGDEAGETYVIFGSTAPDPLKNLNRTRASMTIYGDDADDYSGYSVSSGDINGDGYDDFIIGAPGADPAGGNSAGETYVIFGSNRPRRKKDLNRKPADMTIYGDDGSDRSGSSVSSGDINGDGYDDVIIGAHYASPAGGNLAGETYVIFGSASPPATVDLSSASADMTIYGNNAYDYSGHSVSSGDINGDGYDDVIIGAPYADPAGGTTAGETYVIFGSAGLPVTIDLNSSLADMTIYGDDEGDRCGSSVSSGDINGDGYDDVIIGAPQADPAGGTTAGETYVIFGSAGLPVTIDLNSSLADMTIYGDDRGDRSGYSVSSGDINGDGYDDVIIGAYVADPAGGNNAGETYVIFGSAVPPTAIDLNSSSADMTIYGDDADDLSGWSVYSGDINGDDYDDVIIGARYAGPAGGDFSGETYVILCSGIPLEYYFTDTDIGDWERIGTGKAKVNNGQLVLKRTGNNFRIFPKGAIGNECDIDVKVTRKGGDYSTVSSSIFFSYKDKRNFWELSMIFRPVNSKVKDQWLLRHKKNGKLVQKKMVKETLKRKQQYQVVIEVREGQIRVIVDGMDKMDITPTEKPSWGKIALGYNGNGTCYFDDLIIQ